MPLRVVGAIATVLGLGLVGWAWYSLNFQQDIAASLHDTGRALPVTPEVFLLRTNVLAAVLATSGTLCILGGALLFRRKPWAIFILAAAALLPVLFPPFTRLFAPDALRFEGPLLGDMLVFAIVGATAAMAWMFRSFSEVSPNISLERTRDR